MSGMGAGMGWRQRHEHDERDDGRRRWFDAHMHLQLGSSQSASGEPRAAHDIPPGLNMGPLLPLLSPGVRRRPLATRTCRKAWKKPQGRMKIYWGCGDKVGAGQPVIIDFAKVAAGQRPSNMVSRRVAGASGPVYGRNRTYGDWPNAEDTKAVPAGASLRGEHLVKAIIPEIRFAIGERHDFMAPVSFPARQDAFRRHAGAMASGAHGYRLLRHRNGRRRRQQTMS